MLKGHDKVVYWGEFSPSGSMLVTVSEDDTARAPWINARGAVSALDVA